MFEASRPVYHSTLGLRVIKKKRASTDEDDDHDSREDCRALQPPHQPLHRNVLWYRGGLVCEAHSLLYHSA